ncbi:MAG: hypothetical protein HY242_01530 [Afipia sp.]|nr:hypothetical protein [Afipia sp.]
MRRVITKEGIVAALGILLGVVGISATVLGLKPDEWPDKIDSWLIAFQNFFVSEALNHKWKITFAFAVGILTGYIFKRGPPNNILTAVEFAHKYQELFANQDIRSLLIFGYTYETVRDYQKYEHFYQDGLDIKVLNRCWIAEKIDEESHNKKIEGLDLRKWRKSETIHQAALSPWTYKARREVRYYDFSHPIIKGVILKSKKTTWAFVNFYEWKEVPPEGGSQFKGADLGMIFLDGSISQERSKIHALESQFELVWKFRSHKLDAPRRAYAAYISE